MLVCVDRQFGQITIVSHCESLTRSLVKELAVLIEQQRDSGSSRSTNLLDELTDIPTLPSVHSLESPSADL